jgi:hypothetical protein
LPAAFSQHALPPPKKRSSPPTRFRHRAFAGNTGHGIWGRTEYYSFFDANGATDYTTKSGTDRGHWCAAHDRYCSQWRMSGESCYDIYRAGDRVIWVVPSSGTRYDSALISGEATAVFR